MAEKRKFDGSFRTKDQELIAGINAVAELLKRSTSTRLECLYCRERPGRRQQELIDRARERRVTIKLVPESTLDRWLPDVRHQGVAARVAPFISTPLSTLLSRAEGRPRFRLLALDGVTDPRNLGAILRTAAAAGIDGLLLPERRSAAINALVGKTAAGALEQLPIARVGNLVNALERCKKAGFWVYGAVAAEGRDLYETDWADRTVLVLGSEDRGLRPLVLRTCDYRITIPLAEASESLNVGIAAAIILFEQNRTLKYTRTGSVSKSAPCRGKGSEPLPSRRRPR